MIKHTEHVTPENQNYPSAIFFEITPAQWDEAMSHHDGACIFMLFSWEQELVKALPFVTYHHYRYRDTHLVRVTQINGRYTTAPFSEGSDVVSLTGASLDLVQFENDVRTQFGDTVRLRINERFTPVSSREGTVVVAYEYVVDLTEVLLPRVRKTLRHILQQPLKGQITSESTEADAEAVYLLYLRHMRSVNNFALPKHLFMSLLHDHGGELWMYKSESEIDAMAIFIPTSTQVLYSLSAANETALKANAPAHLVYAALQNYRSKRTQHASLGATGKGSRLEVFKRGWRGKQYCVYELGERSMGVTRTSKIRGLVRYVPLSLYPFISKQIGKYFL